MVLFRLVASVDDKLNGEDDCDLSGFIASFKYLFATWKSLARSCFSLMPVLCFHQSNKCRCYLSSFRCATALR